MEFTERLASCGLTRTEAEILLSVLKTGACSAGSLARRLGYKRPTTYSALHSLESLGLVKRDISRKPNTFRALEPKEITRVLRERTESEFRERHSQIDQVTTELSRLRAPAHLNLGSYEITTVESKEAMHTMLAEALAKGDQRAIFDPDTAISDGRQDLVAQFLKETATSKATIRDIVRPGPMADWYEARVNNPNHEVRRANNITELPTDFLLVAGAVYLNNYRAGEEMVVCIRHHDYFVSMRNLFDYIWESLG